jgi:hypothetical protein
VTTNSPVDLVYTAGFAQRLVVTSMNNSWGLRDSPLPVSTLPQTLTRKPSDTAYWICRRSFLHLFRRPIIPYVYLSGARIQMQVRLCIKSGSCGRAKVN